MAGWVGFHLMEKLKQVSADKLVEAVKQSEVAQIYKIDEEIS